VSHSDVSPTPLQIPVRDRNSVSSFYSVNRKTIP
jgi:hypothetical protein